MRSPTVVAGHPAKGRSVFGRCCAFATRASGSAAVTSVQNELDHRRRSLFAEDSKVVVERTPAVFRYFDAVRGEVQREVQVARS